MIKYRVVVDREGKLLDRYNMSFAKANEAWEYAKIRIREKYRESEMLDDNPWYPIYDENEMRCVLIDDNGYIQMWVEGREVAK